MPAPVVARRTASAGAAAVAATAGAVFANNRYGFLTDIRQIAKDKAFSKRIGARAALLAENATLYHMLELAKQDAQFLWFEGRSWTYAEAIMEIDRLAIILADRGIGHGDFVALFMTNSPEMVFVFAALSKLGAVPALINSALRSHTLTHCMEVASAKLLVCSPDLGGVIVDWKKETNGEIPCLSINLSSFPPLKLEQSSSGEDFVTQIRYEDLNAVSLSKAAPPAARKLSDAGCLIYTSGTSGKPKAVSTKNFQLVIVSTPGSDDLLNSKRYYPLRTFSCLPMFHATCLFTGLFYSVGNSATFCISRKFSASRYFKELTASGATRMLYVGELCRYLLASPPSKFDKAHKCIVASGNGLQKDIWNKFKARFNIPEIREFYRSTEGVAKFDNFQRGSSGSGMVGYKGAIYRWYEQDTYLVKHDPSTEEPYRDPKTGFCVPVKVGEPGEAIGRVRSMAFYNEYLNNPEANKAKLLNNVFEKGDIFQRTGDLLVCEPNGWIRFMDRTGDTYRWKGENVSAGEVREHISRLANVQDVSVYGVKLDGYDGQAGAAGITLIDPSPASESTFISILAQSLKKQGLTSYQMPKLVRFTKQITVNATFKHSKEVLKKRSWDPDTPPNLEEGEEEKDSCYWLNGETGKYEKLDGGCWTRIKGGVAKL